MPSDKQPTDTRPQHAPKPARRRTAEAEFPVKVRIVGTPSDADLDKLARSLRRAVTRQLEAAERVLPKVVHDNVVSRPTPSADWVEVQKADREAIERLPAPPRRDRASGEWVDAKRRDLDAIQRQREDTSRAAEQAAAKRAAKRRELEMRMGTPYSELVLALDLGPIEVDPFDFERALVAAGVLSSPRNTSTDDPAIVGRQTVLDEVLEQNSSSPDRLHLGGRVGTRAQVAQAKEQGLAKAFEIIKRGLEAAGQVRPGSASAGLVVPRARATYQGPARVYDARTGPIKDEFPPYAGLLPPRTSPGEMAANLGFQREMEVVRITKGRLARTGRVQKGGVVEDLELRFRRANGQSGKVRVDVIGPNGELILVGGPAKGRSNDKTSAAIMRAADLKIAAAERGVEAIAYFTTDTPKEVVDGVIKHLGPNNVRLFADPPYREAP